MHDLAPIRHARTSLMYVRMGGAKVHAGLVGEGGEKVEGEGCCDSLSLLCRTHTCSPCTALHCAALDGMVGRWMVGRWMAMMLVWGGSGV